MNGEAMSLSHFSRLNALAAALQAQLVAQKRHHRRETMEPWRGHLWEEKFSSVVIECSCQDNSSHALTVSVAASCECLWPPDHNLYSNIRYRRESA